MKRTILCTLALTLLLTLSASADTFAQQGSQTGAITIDWSQYGVPFTVVGSPAAWVSTSGGTGTASDGGNLERRDEGNGWNGIFTPGSTLLWNQDNGNAIDVHFDTPILGGGAFIQDDLFAPYAGCVQALGSFGSSPVFCVSGNNTGGSTGTAPWIGITDLSGANITDLLFTTLDAAGAPQNATAISNVQYDAVPEPASLLLMGSGLMGLASRLRRKK